MPLHLAFSMIPRLVFGFWLDMIFGCARKRKSGKSADVFGYNEQSKQSDADNYEGRPVNMMDDLPN